MFGQIGRQTQVIHYAGGTPALGTNSRRPKRSGVLPLLLESSISLLRGAMSSLIIWFWTVLRWVFKTFNANRVICLFLGLSIFLNALHSYYVASEAWKEHKATGFMSRLGVHPDGVLSKAIYIKDMDDAIAPVADGGLNSSSTW